MNAKLFMVASAALFVLVIFYKVTHWKKYKRINQSRQPLKIVFSSMEIQGATSNAKREFMQSSNIITAGAAFLLLLTIVVTALNTIF